MPSSYRGRMVPDDEDLSDAVKAFRDFVDVGTVPSFPDRATRTAAYTGTTVPGELVYIEGAARYEMWDGSRWKVLNYLTLQGGTVSGQITAGTGLNDGTTAFRVNKSGSGGAGINAGNQRIVNVGDPTSGDEAMSRSYADGRYIRLDASNGMAGNLSMNGNRIVGVGDPTGGTNALSRGYADDRYVRLDVNAEQTLASPLRVDQLTVRGGQIGNSAPGIVITGKGSNQPGIDMGTSKIVNLSFPDDDNDATPMKWVQNKLDSLESWVNNNFEKK